MQPVVSLFDVPFIQQSGAAPTKPYGEGQSLLIRPQTHIGLKGKGAKQPTRQETFVRRPNCCTAQIVGVLSVWVWSGRGSWPCRSLRVIEQHRRL